MEIILNIDITKLTEKQKQQLAEITDKENFPLKGAIRIKGDTWEKLWDQTPEYLKTRGKWEITK